MGWGAKKTAAPQPTLTTPCIAAGFDDAGNAAVIHVEKPTDTKKAQLAWHELKSRKGWTEATQVMLLYEFIASKDLFAELVKFTRKR